MKIQRAIFGGAIAALAAAVISVTIHGQAPAAATATSPAWCRARQGPKPASG